MSHLNTNRFDWKSDENIPLFNPRISDEEKRTLESTLKLSPLKAHCLLATSGSTSDKIQWVALSKEAMLASAEAVNRFIGASKHDGWLNVLPDFHVGGLAIRARAFLTGSKVDFLSASWSAEAFINACNLHTPAFSSLVPTQLYDLVDSKIPAPSSLKTVFIGGGALAGDLYKRALELGWKLSITYGMTEACSQIASSGVNDEELMLLPHIEAREFEGVLCFKGRSLFTGYLTEDGIVDPKVDGWFKSNDLGRIEKRSNGTALLFEGRVSEQIKISGELVSLHKLDKVLETSLKECCFKRDAAIISVPDERLENSIALVVEKSVVPDHSEVNELVQRFNQKVMPYERIRQIKSVPNIPRSELGKLLRTKLVEVIRRIWKRWLNASWELSLQSAAPNRSVGFSRL